MKLLSIITSVIATGSVLGFAPSAKIHSVSTLKAAAAEEFYIDQDRRNLMNLILVGSATVTVGGLGLPFIAFFFPPSSGGGSGGITAKDALGNELIAKDYLASKLVGDRSLAQGLKGDATYVFVLYYYFSLIRLKKDMMYHSYFPFLFYSYLIVKEDKTLEAYGLNAVCTHLGCVVPWSAPNNKFMCPCHGSQVRSFFVFNFGNNNLGVSYFTSKIVSLFTYPFVFINKFTHLQYAPTGAVVRGPAPLPLALAHCDTNEEGKILFSPWTETDFRTGGKPWWS